MLLLLKNKQEGREQTAAVIARGQTLIILARTSWEDALGGNKLLSGNKGFIYSETAFKINFQMALPAMSEAPFTISHTAHTGANNLQKEKPIIPSRCSINVSHPYVTTEMTRLCTSRDFVTSEMFLDLKTFSSDFIVDLSIAILLLTSGDVAALGH
ncbi:uncharacterized protein LOC143768784 [Ranitomeya variabilis]|uniref:uncharacterized protein LOC143768784 n=1 Tax=Ranitomeya variabilis TaxID=490064 RepID=UPI004057A1B0